MVKIQIKSEKLTPFGGFFSIMEQFDALLAQTIDSTLGLRASSRIKTFVFKFISVLAKWIKTSRMYVLYIYSLFCINIQH